MSQVAHLKGPKENGQRKPIYFQTHKNYVDGLSEASSVESGLMSADDKRNLDNLVSGNDFTTAEKDKLAGIESGAEVNIIDGVSISGGAELPITDKKAILNLSGYVQTETGKGLSTNDFTNAYKQKVDDFVDYDIGNATEAGITKLYPATGTAADGTITQAGINTALAAKANLVGGLVPVSIGGTGATTVAKISR